MIMRAGCKACEQEQFQSRDPKKTRRVYSLSVGPERLWRRVT